MTSAEFFIYLLSFYFYYIKYILKHDIQFNAYNAVFIACFLFWTLKGDVRRFFFSETKVDKVV